MGWRQRGSYVRSLRSSPPRVATPQAQNISAVSTKQPTAVAGPKKFGTFAGVFTPTLLTILGVIMYLAVLPVTEKGTGTWSPEVPAPLLLRGVYRITTMWRTRAAGPATIR